MLMETSDNLCQQHAHIIQLAPKLLKAECHAHKDFLLHRTAMLAIQRSPTLAVEGSWPRLLPGPSNHVECKVMLINTGNLKRRADYICIKSTW